MNDILDVLNKLLESEKIAAEDLSECPVNLRPGRERRQREAAEEVVAYRNMYRQHLQKGLSYIFVEPCSGNKEQRFLEIVEDEGTAVAVRPHELYERITNVIHPSMAPPAPSRAFKVADAEKFLRCLKKEMVDIEVDTPYYPDVTKIVGKIVPTKESVQSLVRDTIRDKYGDSLIQCYNEKKALVEAEARRYDQPILPVVVFGCSLEEIESIKQFSASYIDVINLDDGAGKNRLIGCFKKIQNHYAPPTNARRNQTEEKDEGEEE